MKPCILALVFAFAPVVFAAERIAVVPKGTTHSFWKSVEKGARQAGADLGVEIIWKGPLKEDDRAQQIGMVEQFALSGVSAIALAPLDATALRGPVKTAMERKIPVVIYDSALKGEAGKDFVSFVATDNQLGGEMAGTELARLLGGKGKVVLLRLAEGSASTTARESGFLEVLKRHPGIEVIVDNRYAGPTVSTAQDAAMNLADKLRQSDGVFCPSETSTQGMLLALRQLGLAGKKKFVGFDASPALLAALGKGGIDALVAQNPAKMGYLAVETAVKAIRGEKVSEYIDTGCLLVTSENRRDAAVRAVLGE
jgi:ribose transport system substrate-binding protein